MMKVEVSKTFKQAKWCENLMRMYMKALRQNNGFSLVELVVAMTVLSILVAAFATFFGWNLTSVFEDGQKSKAIARAGDKLERMSSSMENYEESIPGLELYVENYENVFTYQNCDLNFYVKEVIEPDDLDYNVTVVAFYLDGERYVSFHKYIE